MTDASPFVSIPLRPRFFQSSAFFPMPVVLVGTRAEDGQANLAPYSLCFPEIGAEGHRLVLVMRQASKSAANLRRTGLVTLNFIPDRRDHLANCRLLAAPLPTAEKMASSVFSLLPSGRGPDEDGTEAPPLVGESEQVFECRLVSAARDPGSGEERFLLEVEAVLLKPAWATVLESGGRGPRLPVDYGFRRASESWMSRPAVIASGPRLRPRFELELPRPPEVIRSELRRALSRPDVALTLKDKGDNLVLGLPEAELTTWSPTLDLRLDPSDGGTTVRGRIGPQPQVWTTFMFFHMVIAMIGIGGLMWGIASLMTDGPGWPLWMAVGAVLLHLFVAGAAFVGQGLGAEQTYRLRSFIDEVLSP